MRGMFLGLLLVNLVLAGWLVWGKSSSVDRGVVGAAPLPAFERNLVLVSERVTSAGTVDERPMPVSAEVVAAVTEQEPVAAETEPLCTLVGSFAELLQAEYFVEHLAALDVLAKVQQLEVPGDSTYWVYLPPAVSRKEAMRQLHELQAKGFDTYIIPKGPLADGISFGVFSQKGSADTLLRQMQEQGYPVELSEVPRTYKENWVLLQPEEARKVDEELWLKLLSRSEKLEMRQNFCSGVAIP